jgi:hypothetical protein
MESLKILPIDQVAQALSARLEVLSKARVVFIGFALPEEFGESNELQFGDLKQLSKIGLGANSVEMGRSFVLKTIEELFSGEFGSFVPEGTKFFVTEETDGLFTVSTLPPAENV